MPGAFGFCLDNAPLQLQGTGFAGSPSSYATRQACAAAGHRWCPLSNETDTWSVGGQAVEYYWFSACCQGRQLAGLVPDPRSGIPTCAPGRPREECTRMHWHQKAIEDLVDEASGYNFKVAPASVAMPGMRAPSLRTASAGGRRNCLCAVTDPRCVNRSHDGTRCLVCQTRDRCSDDAVSVGIHFFKLHTVDLKTSLLAFSAWLREAWNDPRLKYNAQCYGGLDYFEAVAQSGSLENSMVWTPDLELYNGEETIYQGSLQAHLALVYPCTGDGKPTTGGCGGVFWSRPGLLKALCMYQGLLKFPLDALTCKLEIAGFVVDGRHQDVILRDVDDGVSWTGMPSKHGFVGLTSGSTFQDYSVKSISSARYVIEYDCCVGSPYPTLVWTVEFQRASAYYVLRLIIPAILLAATSFITFWMDPEIGERLGFCITVILAMFTNDVVAAGMMPVANEKLLMDYLSLGCTFFGVLSLFETGVVLFLYHHKAEGWRAALVPEAVRWASSQVLAALHERIPPALARRMSLEPGVSDEEDDKEDEDDNMARNGQTPLQVGKRLSQMRTPSGKDAKIRRQLYRQIFYTVDHDFSGALSLKEVAEFAAFMFGDAWDMSQAKSFIRSIDTNGNGSLGFREFAVFCDACLPHVDDLTFMQSMLDGFLGTVERKRAARQRMWEDRARGIDQFCRWTVPPGFLLFLLILFSQSEPGLRKMVGSSGRQFGLFFAGYVILVTGLLVFVAYKAFTLWRAMKAKNQLCRGRSSEVQNVRTSVEVPRPHGAFANGSCPVVVPCEEADDSSKEAGGSRTPSPEVAPEGTASSATGKGSAQHRGTAGSRRSSNLSFLGNRRDI